MLNVSKIKNLLKEKKITIDELALHVGYTRSGLNKSLNSGDLKASTLEKIAKVLEVPVSFFYSDFLDDLEVFFRDTEKVLNSENSFRGWYDFKKIIASYLYKKYIPFVLLHETTVENSLGLSKGLIRFVIANKKTYLKNNWFKLFFDRYDMEYGIEYQLKDIEIAFYDYIINLEEGAISFICEFLEFSEKYILELPIVVSPFDYLKNLNEQFVSYTYETEFIKWLIYKEFIDIAALTIMFSELFESCNPYTIQ